MSLSKIVLRRTLLLPVLTGLVSLSPALLPYLIQRSSIQSDSASLIENVATVSNQEQALPTQAQANPGLPVHLVIPGINVDSVVEYVGLDSDGAMDIPKSPDNVAWFEPGQRPGEKGSAVIAGHYGGKGSAFDNLYKLRKGDKLYVKDDKGVIISFVVRENRRYDPKADASNVFGSNDGKSHLNLVTCEGTWNKITKEYPKRLVVFTDRETE